MGILAGIVMLRWGILATLIWHYTVDASLVGLLLIRSSSPYLKISGVIVGAAALLPMAYGAFSYLKRGSFETDEELFNRAAPISDVSFSLPAAVSETPVKVRRYDALSGGKILLLAACLLLGAAVVWKLKVPQLGDYLKVSVNAREATVRAGEILRQHGIDPGSYHHATVLVNVTDPFANEFLRERIGIEGLNAIYSKSIPGALWRVRYFRDGQAEEYAVILKPDGSLHSLHHTLAENTPGASLTKDEAVARAEKFLRDEKKLDLTGWSLVEAIPEKRPHRVDYQLDLAARCDTRCWKCFRSGFRKPCPRTIRRGRPGRRAFQLPHVHQNSRGVGSQTRRDYARQHHPRIRCAHPVFRRTRNYSAGFASEEPALGSCAGDSVEANIGLGRCWADCIRPFVCARERHCEFHEHVQNRNSLQSDDRHDGDRIRARGGLRLGRTCAAARHGLVLRCPCLW